MKTAADPRHRKRERLIKHLYSFGFTPHQTHETLLPILKHQKLIDRHIAAAAPEWPLEQINKIDLAILRLATFELLYQRHIPVKVIIDEAVELAKTYGAENTPSFVNGVLGSIMKKRTTRKAATV